MFQKLTDTSYVVSAWSGGTTTQLAIYPENAVYADRDFLWRVSSALVELEESDFTPLPDYDRLIATLEGEIVLSHNGGAPLRLRPLEVHAFSGADATHSWGRCKDFNLMLRRGHASGAMEPLRLTEAPTRLDVGTSIACPQTSPACRGGGAPQRGAEEGCSLPEAPSIPAAGTSIACLQTSPACRGGGAPQRGAEEGCRLPEAPSIPAVGTSIACPHPTPGETFLLYCVEGSCTVGTAPCCPQPAAPVGTAPCRPEPAPACSAGHSFASLPADSPACSHGAPVCAAAGPSPTRHSERREAESKNPAFPLSLRAGETLLCTEPIPLTLTGPATLMLCRITVL
jgi:environmental stress-induced protein Ves